MKCHLWNCSGPKTEQNGNRWRNTVCAVWISPFYTILLYYMHTICHLLEISSSFVSYNLKSINQMCQLMTQCWSFFLVKNRNWEKESHTVYKIFVLCHNGFTSETCFLNIIRITYCFSTGHPVNLKRICTCSVICQMMQYTAMIRRATSPSSQTHKKKTCILYQTHDWTHLYSCLHIFTPFTVLIMVKCTNILLLYGTADL